MTLAKSLAAAQPAAIELLQCAHCPATAGPTFSRRGPACICMSFCSKVDGNEICMQRIASLSKGMLS